MIKACQRPRPSMMIECGPKLVGTLFPGRNVKSLIAETRQKHNLELRVLLYTREEKLAHTNFNVSGLYVDTDNVEKFYQSLNAHGHPFNLAINGSPDFSKHVPFDLAELKYLERIQASGNTAGLRNAVTVADNALVPTLRDHFPGLDVIASCISVAFEPNLVAFRNSHGVEYNDPQFLIKYYNHLYSIYDMVVPITQLSTPAFLSSLNVPKEDLSKMTILFINLGCGSPQLGRCIEHYKGIKDQVRPNMPVIPDEFMAKPEDAYEYQEESNCSKSFDSLELMNRFADLRALWKMGIHQFKIPTRSSDPDDVLNFLLSFVTQYKETNTFPKGPSAHGYLPADFKLSFMGKYPPSVHKVLRDFTWPRLDSNCGGAYYCGYTSDRIREDLHSRALDLWESIPK